MKIVYFTDLFLPYENGVTTSIINNVSSLTKHGHTVCIVYPKVKTNKTIFKNNDNVILQPLPSIPSPLYPGSRISLPFSFDFLRNIKEFNPDIIHFHTPFFIGSSAILLSKILKKPLVGTFHGYFMEPEYLKIVGLDKLRLDKNQTLVELGWKYSDMFYNQADVVICPTKTTKLDLIEKGITPPIEVISNGIDIDEIYTIRSSKPKKNYRLPKQYFLTFSRVSPEKSIDILIESFKLIEKSTDTHLIIVGDGPARKHLEELVQSHNLTRKVHFYGEIDHTVLMNSNLIRNAIAFITASKTETQGMSVMESVAFGLPVIGVNAKAVPELITSNGILCKPDHIKELSEAMYTLATDETKRKQYSEASLQLVKCHSIHETTIKLLTIYTALQKEQ